MREQDLAPLASPEVEIVQGEEGKPVIFKAIVQIRPEIKLGDFEHFGFTPEIKPVDETMVEKVVDELREAEGTLEPVEGRGAVKGDYMVIGFVGSRDGVPFPGGTSERMPSSEAACRRSPAPRLRSRRRGRMPRHPSPAGYRTRPRPWRSRPGV